MGFGVDSLPAIWFAELLLNGELEDGSSIGADTIVGIGDGVGTCCKGVFGVSDLGTLGCCQARTVTIKLASAIAITKASYA